MTLLQLTNISANYGAETILKNVTLEVKPASIVSLIGPNGAGKSTILKTIFGLTNQEEGTITYKKQDISNKQTHELLKLGISYVPQGRINFSTLTVQENLQLGGKGLQNKELLQQRLQEVHKRFPILKTKQEELAYNLSGGEQQQLALARALMHKPQLLLLDEPTLGLSPKLVQELFKTLTQLKKDGISLLIVEQNAKKAIENSDETYVLEQGKIVLSGGRELQKHPQIKSIYLGGDTKE